MPGYLTDKCIEIRNWLALGDDVYPDPIVTGWIRMAEEYLSTVLRVKHMVQIDVATITEDRVPLPRDWQEVRMMRILPGGGACRYQTPDAFYNPEFPGEPESPYPGRRKRYTIIGNYGVFGEVTASPGLQAEITYYQNIPPLLDTLDNWANRYHPIVYTLKILHIASLYSIEDERGTIWDKEVTRAVNDMNSAHKVDMASGSVLLQTRRKTFG